jgi:hypothetical protein
VIDDDQFNQHFPYSAKMQNSRLLDKSLFLSNTWCLYKSIKYESKLIQFKLDLFSSRLGAASHKLGTDEEAAAQAVSRAAGELCNKLAQVLSLTEAKCPRDENGHRLESRDLEIFEWLLLKTLLHLNQKGMLEQLSRLSPSFKDFLLKLNLK